MGIQFFGEFLIDRWVITRGQLIEALELQDYRNQKFGEVAVQKGLLTEEQVKQINERQKTEDKRIADLAVSMEMMEEQQAREILTFQKNNHLYLGEALLELGHITDDILERELAIFNEEQSRYTLEDVSVPAGVQGVDLMKVTVDLTRKMFQRVASMLVKVGDGVLAADQQEPAVDYHLSVSVAFEGTATVHFVLSASSDVAVSIAGRILHEDATRESEEVVEDAVKEFCNIICGNAAAKLAQMGLQTEIAPPESLSALPTAPADTRVVVFPARLAEGGLDLRFVVPVAHT